MFKILLAIGFLILSSFPDSGLLDSLQSRLLAKINEPSPKTTQTKVPRVETVELAEDYRQKTVGAKAAYFFDLDSGQVVLQKNADTKLQVASLTKLMTAIVVVENAKLDDTVTIGSTSTHSDDAVVGLVRGDKLTVRQLLDGLLVASGSDAALALAEHTSGSQVEFVAQMNQQATVLGLSRTHFSNPVGWDDAKNYSTAHDLAILSKIALTNPTIRQTVAQKSVRFNSANGRPYNITNTNKLLGGGYLGVKTGTTYAAGECLATYYQDSSRRIVGVVLSSSNRFTESRGIVDWAKGNLIFSPE